MDLIVDFKATNLVTNFEELKREVASEVEKYSVEVTEENIPEAKKVMANLNKVKTEIGKKYKHHIDTLSLPINQLKTEKKELESIITQGRQKIADEVARFEAKKLEIARDRIYQYLSDICLDKGIDYKAVNVDDLVKLTAITSKGSLAKATKEVIENRVSLVENEILKAKLEAEEKAKRDREIAERARKEAEERARQRELQLQRENEERLRLERERAEREKQEAIEKAKLEAQKEKLPENTTVVQKVAPKEADDGKMIYTVLATFEVKAPKGIDKEKIVNALGKKLQGAGITTCKSIEVM